MMERVYPTNRPIGQTLVEILIAELLQVDSIHLLEDREMPSQKRTQSHSKDPCRPKNSGSATFDLTATSSVLRKHLVSDSAKASISLTTIITSIGHESKCHVHMHQPWKIARKTTNAVDPDLRLAHGIPKFTAEPLDHPISLNKPQQ